MYPANSLTDPSLAVPFEGKGLDPNDRKVNINARDGTIVCELLTTKKVKSPDVAPIEFQSNVSFKGNVDITGSVTQSVDTLYENARRQNPNEPENYGTSRSVQARSYVGYPFQAGNEFGTGLKIEYDSGVNKSSISAMDVSITFDLVPSSTEAGAMDSEITGAGFVGPFAARTNNYSWYGVTCDDQNFYYVVNGSPSFFAGLFGFGTNSLYVCRRKSDAKLLWVKNSSYYSLNLPGSTNLVGSPIKNGRTTLAIHKDRLYTCDNMSNLGPQVYCINKTNGERIWSMLYHVPPAAGGGFLVSPATPFGSANPAPYAGSNYEIGDMNIVVKELAPGVPSVFVGSSSYQNAINGDRVWNTMTDQGLIARVDDLGATAVRTWLTSTCVNNLSSGDTITAGGDPLKDPFRPGQTEVLVWRQSTDGKFATAGGVTGKVLDNTGPHPGFRPQGYTGPGTANNLRMPAVYGRVVVTADLPLTEASFRSTFQAAAPGIGGGARVYQYYASAATTVAAGSNAAVLPQGVINVASTAAFPATGTLAVQSTTGYQTVTYTGKTATSFTGCAGGTGTLATGGRVAALVPTAAKTMANVLADLNAALPAQLATAASGVVVYLFAYLTGAEVTAIDGAAAPFLAANVGTRYIAALPTPYTLVNAQEANALNYYGNSTWAQQPVVDVERNMLHFGTGQSHGQPADEILLFQDPAKDLRDRAQPVIDAMYRYTQNDAALAGAGPFATLDDINTAKDLFCTNHRTLCLDTLALSPRGRRSYSDAIIGLDLTTGAIQFGVRTQPGDMANFNSQPRVLKNTFLIGPDADTSSGLQLFESVRKADGKIGQYIATCTKGGIIAYLDISGINPAVPWNHSNAVAKGINPKFAYGGSLSALGGSNYGSAQSGGQFLLFEAHNASTDVGLDIGGSGIQSNTYQANNFLGWEFHVTRDGRVFQIRDSIIGAFDVGKGEIVWEENIGQASQGFPCCYNGVAIHCTSQGIIEGYDVSDGHKIWSLDTKIIPGSSSGLGGITPPVFDRGVAYCVINYPYGPGRAGQKGVILKISSAKIIPADATAVSLLGGKTFNSYNVVPKKAPILSTQQMLIEPETITHVWSAGGVCTATHTPDGGAPEVVTTTAESYITAGKVITLVSSGALSASLRYKYIEMLNATDYVLFYQRLQSGVWVDHRAVCRL